MIAFAHYNPATGEIAQVGLGTLFEIAGLAVARFENVSYQEAERGGYRVDLASVNEGLCTLIR